MIKAVNNTTAMIIFTDYSIITLIVKQIKLLINLINKLNLYLICIF